MSVYKLIEIKFIKFMYINILVEIIFMNFFLLMQLTLSHHFLATI